MTGRWLLAALALVTGCTAREVTLPDGSPRATPQGTLVQFVNVLSDHGATFVTDYRRHVATPNQPDLLTIVAYRDMRDAAQRITNGFTPLGAPPAEVAELVASTRKAADTVVKEYEALSLCLAEHDDKVASCRSHADDNAKATKELRNVLRDWAPWGVVL